MLHRRHSAVDAEFWQKDLRFQLRSFEFRRCERSRKRMPLFGDLPWCVICRSPHKTSIILDTTRTGRDWPVMWCSRLFNRQPFAAGFHVDGNAVDQASAATAVGNSLGNHSLHSEVRPFGQYRRHENLFCRARQVVLRQSYAHGKWRDSLASTASYPGYPSTLEPQESLLGNPERHAYIYKDEGTRTFSDHVGLDYAARSYRWCNPPSRARETAMLRDQDCPHEMVNLRGRLYVLVYFRFRVLCPDNAND